MDVMEEEGTVENAVRMGRLLMDGVRAMQSKYEMLSEVRGLGLFWGIELVRDRATKEMYVPFNASGEAAAPIARLAKTAMGKGLSLMTHWNVAIVAPPLTITRDELEEGFGILDEVLDVADEYYTG